MKISSEAERAILSEIQDTNIQDAENQDAEIQETGTGAVANESGSAVCHRMEPVKRIATDDTSWVACHAPHSTNGNQLPPGLLSEQQHTVVDLEKVHRVALMVTPQNSGDSVADQAWEGVSTIRAVVKQQAVPMTVTSQTVFVRRAEDIERCRQLFAAYFGDRTPVTNFVVQPPCGGQALAIEAWALGGDGTEVQFLQPDVVSVAYDGLRWIHLSGITPPSSAHTAYEQAKSTFDELALRLEQAGASFQDIVRVWLYQGSINRGEEGIERYRELNRARTDFFAEQEALGRMSILRGGSTFYPASTGIGMNGGGLAVSGLAMQTQRSDVRLQPLENPHQTSAFQYAASFSKRSPKFSRAMAMAIGDYVTTWISGTASIINSDSVHLGDAAKQTEQTIDNIQRLITAENFARHGIAGAGARLEDLAKIRVYVKRPEDYEICRAVCERRFGPIPAIYAQADVCRGELLVEIEGVAFSRLV